MLYYVPPILVYVLQLAITHILYVGKNACGQATANTIHAVCVLWPDVMFMSPKENKLYITWDVAIISPPLIFIYFHFCTSPELHPY